MQSLLFTQQYRSQCRLYALDLKRALFCQHNRVPFSKLYHATCWCNVIPLQQIVSQFFSLVDPASLIFTIRSQEYTPLKSIYKLCSPTALFILLFSIFFEPPSLGWDTVLYWPSRNIPYPFSTLGFKLVTLLRSSLFVVHLILTSLCWTLHSLLRTPHRLARLSIHFCCRKNYPPMDFRSHTSRTLKTIHFLTSAVLEFYMTISIQLTSLSKSMKTNMRRLKAFIC